MRRKLVAIGISCVLLAGSELLAERCIGPKDNTVALTYGVPAINAADITWCEDFDTYCDTNCGDCLTGAPTSVWPGYPPTPDNVCAEGAVSNETFFREPYHWPQVTVDSGLPVSSSAPGSWFPPGANRWEGWDGNDGWTSQPYTLMYQGGSNTNAYHTFSLEGAANHKFPGSNALNGTDANPLIIRFWINPAEGPAVFVPDPANPGKYLGPPQTPPNLPLYVELRMENDHAPTDYVMKNCSPEAQGPYPTVCQERLTGFGQRPTCPPLSTQVHSSVAFGWLSTVDVNPCDVENGRKPTAYHSSVFDGIKWHQLLRNIFGYQVGGFNWDTGQAYFEMKIKTNVVEIKQIAYFQIKECVDPPDCTIDRPAFALLTSTAPVPRKYFGPFNRISIGAAPGCELNSAGVCISQPDVWRYMQTHSDWGWSKAYVDNVAILGGVGESVNGACCMGDGTCSNITRTQCEAAGGSFQGIQTTCESGACLGACCQPRGICTETTSAECPGQFRGFGTVCSDPNACPCYTPQVDADGDGDVDMNDFAKFQRCLTMSTPIGEGCGCFDKDGDGTIGTIDLEYFAKCATGEGVTWAPSLDCP